jgi:protein-S-isoprenylcysteine O-methyltransferase Ste14
VLIVGGIGWIVLARRELRHYKQPTDPGHPTHQLVQTGVFAHSRNPIYLGCALVLCGIALATQSVWIVGSLVVSIVGCHYILIVPEERYLAAKFGPTYRDYTAAVRRWYGRIARRP